MKPTLLAAGGAVIALVSGGAVSTSASASTISIVSDASTLAGVTTVNAPGLTTGDTTGVTFGADVVGAFGTFTQPPPGAPSEAVVINIPPGDGESGFFKVDFTLPTNYGTASISGAANADDNGFVFLNGVSLASISEFGNATFATADQSLFHAGVNEFLVSDNNSGGGPSGAAFFATVTYGVPEPASWAMMLVGVGGLGALMRARRKQLDVTA